MKKNRLGQTALYLSELSFGGASIGNLYQPTSYDDALATVKKSVELGINYFDTAPEYGHGLSERRLGDALRLYPRDQFVLSTKVGERLYACHNVSPPVNKFIDKLPFFLRYDYSYDGIMRSFEDSLQRLGLSRIDIILVHDLDPIIHDQNTFLANFKLYLEEGYQALDELRTQGVIQAIGLGVKTWEVCRDAMKYGQYDCFMLQGNYTLLEQTALDPFLSHCMQNKVSILLAGPYASGILATGPVKGAYYHHRKASPEIVARVKQIKAICDAYEVPLQAVALQFPLKHPAIASVVVGAANPLLMQENIDYLNIKIPQALWGALQDQHIIPKEAPI